MKRLTPLLLLLPALASAQDRGELAFTKACAQCHQARTPTEPQPKGVQGARAPVGPYMDQVLRRKNLKEVQTWVQSPHRINPKTNCDTRLLGPDDLDALTSFLATVTVAPPPTRQMMLRQQMDQLVTERAVREKAEAEAKAKSQPKNQGKK
ncbi:c-type cytochrome [Corallococcus macrosporus]|uniref:C-type cytochrome n=1 Tax=Corallococcus macrosporus TaxID=35 RepID=A0ABS3DE90_9BACT|nr:c-type cytochrome [Corallococcus macrosporus]MBN8229227.1 c-type cytochrome [Corallococcus macrosporus]